jgi:hypothetical protein
MCPSFIDEESLPSGVLEQQCPYCGEDVEVSVDPVGAGDETYVEDCPVCCRPWTVNVSREDGELRVTLSRGDD